MDYTLTLEVTFNYLEEGSIEEFQSISIIVRVVVDVVVVVVVVVVVRVVVVIIVVKLHHVLIPLPFPL